MESIHPIELVTMSLTLYVLSTGEYMCCGFFNVDVLVDEERSSNFHSQSIIRCPFPDD